MRLLLLMPNQAYVLFTILFRKLCSMRFRDDVAGAVFLCLESFNAPIAHSQA